jgi:hypothetical protein
MIGLAVIGYRDWRRPSAASEGSVPPPAADRLLKKKAQRSDFD